MTLAEIPLNRRRFWQKQGVFGNCGWFDVSQTFTWWKNRIFAGVLWPQVVFSGRGKRQKPTKGRLFRTSQLAYLAAEASAAGAEASAGADASAAGAEASAGAAEASAAGAEASTAAGAESAATGSSFLEQAARARAIRAATRRDCFIFSFPCKIMRADNKPITCLNRPLGRSRNYTNSKNKSGTLYNNTCIEDADAQ